MEIKITINVGGNDPIEIRVDVPEKGETSVEKKPTEPSCHARWFNESYLGWSKHPELNKVFLIQQQEAANFMLKKKGYLFLNEVYDMLGIPRTAAGQLVGWVYDPENPSMTSYVDFGLYADRNTGFINATDDRVLLDFNVDGNILEYL